MAHKGEMKTLAPSILHTSKFCLEAWLYCMGTCHTILGTEVESLAVPLAVDINNIIKLRIFRWWLDIFRLQYCFNEFICFRGDFHFQRFGEWRWRCFTLRHRPSIDFLWHPIPPCHAGVPRVFLCMSMTSQTSPAIAGRD